jgi:hypothetical protein
MQAAKQFLVHAGHAGRGFPQPLPIGVFADGQEDFPHRPLDSRSIHPAGGVGGRILTAIPTDSTPAKRAGRLLRRFHSRIPLSPDDEDQNFILEAGDSVVKERELARRASGVASPLI